MGWVSMNRYWQALVNESAGDDTVHSLLPAGRLEAGAGPVWQRFWMRGVGYPWRIKTQVKDGVLHVLDHSFADLLAYVNPGVKTVVTVHDLIPLTDPGDLSSQQVRRFKDRVQWVTRADRVVCVSQHTAAEAQRLLGVPTERVRVLPNGASALPRPDPALSARLQTLKPCLLSVGSAVPRKNLKLLAPLAAGLAARGISPVIVRAGASLPDSLAQGIRQHAELLELGQVTDAELSAAYAGAAVTVVPSFQEGFGLPVLEAMLAGCPVAYSRATSLPEVAGDAGLSFDPHAVGEAVEVCARLLENEELRQKQSELGRKRAAVFSWQHHWQGLRAVYNGLVSD